MSPNQSEHVDRRRFLATCAACVAASTFGCASLATRPVSAVGGVVRLARDEYPELARVNGFAKILPDGERDPVIVLALGGDQYAVLSPICTHRGCTVDVQGEYLVCPCHGSTYDRGGAVVRGPAERPLRRFTSRVSGRFIEFSMREPA